MGEDWFSLLGGDQLPEGGWEICLLGLAFSLLPGVASDKQDLLNYGPKWLCYAFPE